MPKHVFQDLIAILHDFISSLSLRLKILVSAEKALCAGGGAWYDCRVSAKHWEGATGRRLWQGKKWLRNPLSLDIPSINFIWLFWICNTIWYHTLIYIVLNWCIQLIDVYHSICRYVDIYIYVIYNTYNIICKHAYMRFICCDKSWWPSDPDHPMPPAEAPRTEQMGQ